MHFQGRLREGKMLSLHFFTKGFNIFHYRSLEYEIREMHSLGKGMVIFEFPRHGSFMILCVLSSKYFPAIILGTMQGTSEMTFSHGVGF